MNTMKFLHLPIGQQFEFRGSHYTKVAPLIASNNADGKQKMIPRSALVGVATGLTLQPETDHHPAQAVLERYHQSVLAELRSLSDDEAKLGAARTRLEALREELALALQPKEEKP